MTRKLFFTALSIWALCACKPAAVDHPHPVLFCTDAPLLLETANAPELGDAGCIRLLKEDGTEVDCIDLADLANVRIREDGTMIPVSPISATSPYHSFMDALPSGGRYRIVHYTPLRLGAKSLEIKFHSGVMEFGKKYSVTVDAGVVKGHEGIKEGEWTFETKAKPTSATLNVQQDGSGDFCTLQGALSYAKSLSKTSPVTINLGEGTYREMLYLRDRPKLTIKGCGRDKCRIVYPNNESWCSGSGSAATARPRTGAAIGTAGGRVLFLVENCDELQMEDLTIENSFGELKGQAETIYFNSGNNTHRLTIENCALISFQDTFLCKGRVWVHNSLIAGHCDYIWGYPDACLFEDCEIRSRAAGYIVQARVPSETAKGFVFLNCALTAEEGVKDGSMYLARSGGDNTKFDNVTFVNCTLSPVIAATGWYTNPAPNPSKPTAQSGWKEYGSKDASGNPVNSHNASGKVLTAEEAEAFSSRGAVLGY